MSLCKHLGFQLWLVQLNTMFALFESETSERSADGACGGCSGSSAGAAASPGGAAGQPSVAATVKLLERAAELYSQVDKHSFARRLFSCNVEVARLLERRGKERKGEKKERKRLERKRIAVGPCSCTARWPLSRSPCAGCRV